MKPAATITKDEWLTAIEALNRTDDVEGDTVEQIAGRWGKSYEWTRTQVLRLVAAGKAQHVGHRKRGSTRLKVYRLVDGKAKAKK